MSYPTVCDKCGGKTYQDTEYTEQGAIPILKCLLCGSRPLLQNGKRNYSPPVKDRPRSLSRTPATSSVPSELKPPPVPEQSYDWEQYLSECTTYAAIKWFQAQAKRFHQSAKSCRKQREKWWLTYRAKLYERLAESLKTMNHYWNQNLSKSFSSAQKRRRRVPNITDKQFGEMYKRYMAQMSLAMVWLPDDPIVKQWHGSRVTLGDKDYLRRSRKGLEKDVQRPCSPQELELELEIMALHLDGKSVREIHTSVHARKLVPSDLKLPVSSLHKRIQALRKDPPYNLLAK